MAAATTGSRSPSRSAISRALDSPSRPAARAEPVALSGPESARAAPWRTRWPATTVDKPQAAAYASARDDCTKAANSSGDVPPRKPDSGRTWSGMATGRPSSRASTSFSTAE